MSENPCKVSGTEGCVDERQAVSEPYSGQIRNGDMRIDDDGRFWVYKQGYWTSPLTPDEKTEWDAMIARLREERGLPPESPLPPEIAKRRTLSDRIRGWLFP